MKKGSKTTKGTKTSKTDAARIAREDAAKAKFDAEHPVADLAKGTTVAQVTTGADLDAVLANNEGALVGVALDHDGTHLGFMGPALDYDGTHLDMTPEGAALTEADPGDGTEFAKGPEDIETPEQDGLSVEETVDDDQGDSENAALDAELELAKVEGGSATTPGAPELTKEERDRKRERDRDALRKTLGPARTNAIKFKRVLVRMVAAAQVMAGWKVSPEDVGVTPILATVLDELTTANGHMKMAVNALEAMPMGWAPHSTSTRVAGPKVSKELAVDGFAIVRESARKEYEGVNTDFAKAMRVVAVGKKMVTLIDAKGGQLMIRRSHLVATAAPEASTVASLQQAAE